MWRLAMWELALAAVLAAGLFVRAAEAGPAGLTRDFEYWRGACEKTPGAFLCVKPDATDVVVTCDRWPDCTDLRRFGLDAIRLSGAKTDHEKALAVWRWMRRVKSQTNGDAPTDPFHPERQGAQVNDPIKILNVYGAHWCSGLARTTAMMWRALGHEGHAVHRTSHGMAGLRYQDADGVSRYHLFDCNFGGYTLDRSGRRVLGMDEFSTDTYQWMHVWYFGEPWPMPTHRAELALRRGETLRRVWGNWGKPFHDNVSAKEDKRFRVAGEKGPYPVTFGNGLWTYAPDLSAPAWRDGLAEPAVNLTEGKLAPAEAGRPAQVVWHFRTPYIAVETEIELKAFRKGPGDTIRLLLSVDGGKTWKPCWRAPADQTGKRTHTVRLDGTFKVNPRKWEVPAGFNSPFGRYAYRIKLELSAKDQPGDCRVDGITFGTTVQQAIRSLPQLWPGRNGITVRGKLAKGAAVRVTYVWDDPAGKARRNVTVAETLPHTYEIVAAGAKWADVVCRELTVEAVPATGEGSRTVVKEKPSPIAELPPEVSADATRTRWIRPLHGGKPAPPVEKVVAWLGERRTVAEGLRWAAELADPKAFDAVKTVAYDREICAKKGVKELALVALFNTDRARARPVLLDMAKDVGNSPWRGGDDLKYAGGAWLSGVCIIGQMAAQAGWKEFAPVVAAALDSKYCGGKTDRMALLRPLARLAQPGDAQIAEANRKSLAMEYPYMLVEAAHLAGVLGDRQAIPRLRELLDHPFLAVRRSAAVALGRLKDTASAARLRESLVRIRKREVLDHVKYGTEIRCDENMRAAAARALALMADKASLPALKRAAAGEPVPWVREEMARAIRAIGEP